MSWEVPRPSNNGKKGGFDTTSHEYDHSGSGGHYQRGWGREHPNAQIINMLEKTEIHILLHLWKEQ